LFFGFSFFLTILPGDVLLHVDWRYYMKRIEFHCILIAFGFFMLSGTVIGSDIIRLPVPRYDSDTSVEEALKVRKSVRRYAEEPLLLSDISQILWAAQGITRKMKAPPGWQKYKWQGGFRTAPSAGALYPLDIYLVVGDVKGLPKGVYKYIPQSHSIEQTLEGDRRTEVSNAALKQAAIRNGAAVLVITAVVERTAVKYGRRADRYVHMEVGHVGQNVYLQGVSSGIGTVMIGAFYDQVLKKALDLSENEHPFAIMPMGKIVK
jgi:SagB-type dehydrogenase family enzyme